MTEPLQLGKYQLIRRLATGGMAELFLARDAYAQGPQPPVVLKRILPQHAESEDFIHMFLTEARLAVNLDHENIVRVHDIGEDQGQYFFTMEYVQGQDLRRFVRRARKLQRAIPLEHILHVIIGVAAGLHHAHDQVGPDGEPLGIVHRDVSPSNVLVTYGGDVKVVDFGIAKAATAQVATIAGTLKGKIPYMSPEQCRGESVDRRSDIFTIGTLLWELTTGKRLFAGDNEFAILNRVAKGDVPVPTAIRPDYPPELEAIVMRALQPLPEHRYATAEELQHDLEDFAREARLPLSSVRMARFMGELFDEDLRESLAEVELIAQGGLPNLAPLDVRSPRETQEYTPSGLRPGSTPTAGPSYADIEGSSTHVGAELEVLQPTRQRASGWWALAGLLVVGAGAVGALSALDLMPELAIEQRPARVLESPPAQSPSPAIPEEISAVPPPPAPVPEPVVQPPKDEEEETLVIDVDSEPEQPEKAEADTAKPRPRQRARSRSTAERKPAKKKPSSRRVEVKPEPESEAPAKPKWDPDAPLPPGM